MGTGGKGAGRPARPRGPLQARHPPGHPSRSHVQARGPRPHARPRPAHLCGSSGAARAQTGPETAGRGGSGSCCCRRLSQEAAPRRPARPRRPHRGRWLGSMPAAHPRDEDPALPGPRSACLFCLRPVNCARRGGAGAPRGPAPSPPHVPALPAGAPAQQLLSLPAGGQASRPVGSGGPGTKNSWGEIGRASCRERV